MKKWISLLLVFVTLFCCSCTGPVPAEKAYYVTGTASLCGSEWNPADANNLMTLNANGLYEKTYTNVPAGTHSFHITDGTPDNCWGVAGGSYEITLGFAQDVTIFFHPETKEISVSLAGASAAYYVIGTSSLCGSEWDLTDSTNLMTLNDAGLYEKTYSSVPAGTHQFQITDGSWDHLWGVDGGNYVLVLEKAQDVTILFNPETKEITVTGPEAPPSYYVAGQAALCGSEWDPGDWNNKMIRIHDSVYEKIYAEVPAGTYELKVTDGTWDNSWGQDGANYVITLTQTQNVTVLFHAETGEVTVSLSETGDDYYVAGTFDLCGVEWDPGYAGNKMLLSADGLYKKTFFNVPAGSHEFKTTIGTWSSCWGLNGNNFVFTTEEESDVTITFDAESKEILVILTEATPGLVKEEPDPVSYDITINVHYYRADGDYTSWEVHMWNGADGLSATRKFADETVEHDGKQWKVATYYADAADSWVGFIVKKPDWTKDPDGDRHVDISDVTGGVVNVYAVSGSALNDFEVDKSQAEMGAKVTAAVYDHTNGTIEVTTSCPIENLSADTFTLEGPDGQVVISSVESISSCVYRVICKDAIDADNVYTLYYKDVPCIVTVPNLYSTEGFEAEFTYTGNDLGAVWSAESTTFRVWAPTAAAVSVNLYATGSDKEAGAKKLGSHEMTPDVNGTWVVTVEGDLNGVYYTYSVTRKGETVEAVDPYARTTGINGNRAMVIDLDSTDPEGWEKDTYVTVDNYTDAVIWELHVRDFSIDPSSGMTNQGKYLAFTENGTTVPGTDIATGVDYMVNLGVKYVHLLPVYDINSVDETTGGYNWGYDPKNYNVPEGSYSTDPYNGAVRVNEFKQMVQALHSNGIGVVMDVVYNHVADAGSFCFNQIVPGYFSRIYDDGSYQSNSGCGNDTATERAMVRKYIVDSVLYWAEEYHIDGFRWDLVGLIDYETINEVMEEVHKVNPNIIFYGEGWEMCTWTTKDGYVEKMTTQNNDQLVNSEAHVFAFFNDTIRNLIHGGVFNATNKGFVSGRVGVSAKKTLIDSYMGNSTWGSAGETVDTPLQTINYASCHDNYTLFDNLTLDVMSELGCTAEEARELAVSMNKLAAGYYITAQGVPFIHAGEEMLRSKPDANQTNGFNHNSYASGDQINAIKWSSLTDETVSDCVAYYTGLIAFRNAHPALRMTSEEEVLAAMSVLETGNSNVVAILNNGGNAENNNILSIFNADREAHTVKLPAGVWYVYVNKDDAGTVILATVEGEVVVESTSTMILVQAKS